MGSVKISKIGLIIVFTRPKTTATIKAVPMPCKCTPDTICAVTNIAKVLITRFNKSSIDNS